MIVIVTHSQDLTADFVIRHLVTRSAEFIRLDTDTLSTPKRHFGFDRGCPVLNYDGVSVAANKVSALWARRFSRPHSLESVSAPYSKFVQRELRDLTEAFIDAVSGLVVNSYETDRRAGNRLTQSLAAAEAGLTVPITLVTQDVKTASDFATKYRAIAKAISFGVLTEDSELVVHTTSVDADKLDGVEVSPVLLQNDIEKKHEWRVTTVGSRVFAARTRLDVEIDKSDWRRSADVKNIFELACLPSDIEEGLMSLCKAGAIHFGAHDLIEKPDGTFVFLETNPAGQWGWLELTLGLPIGEAVADLLLQGGGT